MSYILDLEKLRVGDVVLSSGDGKAAEVIKRTTGSHYSHAMLYVDHQINHAIPEGGVYSVNPQRLIFKSPEDLKVLRLKKNVEMKTLLSVCDFSGTLVGSVYSVKEAVATKILGKLNVGAKTSDQFCSRLVAQSYESVGIKLVANPSYCSPADLESSNELEVVEGAVRLASSNELLFAQTPDPTQRNQAVTYEWLYKVRDLASSVDVKIQTINDVNEFLLNNPQLDQKICKYIRESGYLEQYLDDTVINPHRYDMSSYQHRIALSGASPQEFVNIDLRKELGLVRRMIGNVNCSKVNYINTNQNYHALHVELYTNILLLAKKRLEIMALNAGPDDLDIIQKLVESIESQI
ncbi:hypothetical protein RUK41_001061 [Vibrio cholerae]|nr:hypothetical protein [Vibrio cholerae]